MKKLDFIFFDAGGGHRAAANALKLAIEQGRYPFEVRLVNLQETLDELDIFRKLTGVRMQDIYNHMLRKGWTLGSGLMIAPMHGIIGLYRPSTVASLKAFWQKDTPDAVISLVPNFNRTLFEAYRGVKPDGPYVGILTDMADYPPHFWIERNQDQHFICGTERAMEQARAMGHPPDRVHRVSGMILHPRFYEPIEVDRAGERASLGLKPDLPTGLVLFGGFGSNAMATIAQRIAAARLPVQFIFACGKNDALKSHLEAMQLPFPAHIVGFTSEVPRLMSVSDFFLGKPGPGSISEAMKMGLPVILERNARTLPQERFNTDWVKQEKVGIVLDDFSSAVAGVRQMLEPATLARFRCKISAMNNRAVFEVPEILQRILDT